MQYKPNASSRFFSTWSNMANEGIYSLGHVEIQKVCLGFTENAEGNHSQLLFSLNVQSALRATLSQYLSLKRKQQTLKRQTLYHRSKDFELCDLEQVTYLLCLSLLIMGIISIVNFTFFTWFLRSEITQVPFLRTI